jgi:shikimate kinase
MNKIYLVGLPGAGKSHSGKLLAEKLHWNFVDLDILIENELNKTIGDIFDEHGEEIFRKLEKEVLKKTEKLQNTVISCGGGTAAFEKNMEWMQKKGLTIFLNPPIENIIPRIIQNQKKRPLFRGLKEAQLRKKLAEFAEKRGKYYSKARLVWNAQEPNDKLYSAVNQLLKLYSAPF